MLEAFSVAKVMLARIDACMAGIVIRTADCLSASLVYLHAGDQVVFAKICDRTEELAMETEVRRGSMIALLAAG